MSASSNRIYFLYHELRASHSKYSYVVEHDAFEHHADMYLKARSGGDATFWPEITFDDGHISNYELALPSLASRGLTATFFLTVGWMGTRVGYMGWDQVRALHASGQRIGAHGWTHTLLTHCDDKALGKELQTARLTLEDKLGDAIQTMSLPGGRFNERVLDACRAAGYTQVYTSVPRAEKSATTFLPGRLNIRSTTNLDSLAQILDSRSGLLAKLQRQEKWKGTLKEVIGDRMYAKLWATLNRQEPGSDADETTLA